MDFKKIKIGIVFLLFSALFCSCDRYDVIVHYQYNGATITRLDKDAASRFYYGSFSKESNLPENYIEGSYHGFDGVMQGYLIFGKDKKVELVPTTYFEQKGVINDFSVKQYENPDFIAWRDGISSNLGNVIEISDGIKGEKEDNLKNHSKVKASYQ